MSHARAVSLAFDTIHALSLAAARPACRAASPERWSASITSRPAPDLASRPELGSMPAHDTTITLRSHAGVGQEAGGADSPDAMARIGVTCRSRDAVADLVQMHANRHRAPKHGSVISAVHGLRRLSRVLFRPQRRPPLKLVVLNNEESTSSRMRLGHARQGEAGRCSYRMRSSGRDAPAIYGHPRGRDFRSRVRDIPHPIDILVIRFYRCT